jgi:hypothetical protein
VPTVVEPRTGLGLPPGVTPPDTVRFHPTGILLGQDRVALDIVRLTRWKRPLHMACTVSPENLSWLRPFARLDGLALRIVPSDDPSVWDVEHLRRQLIERVSYRDIGDPDVPMDRDSRMLCTNHLAALMQLAMAQVERGQAQDALATLRFIDAYTPLARLGMAAGPFAAMRAQIEAAAGARDTTQADPR